MFFKVGVLKNVSNSIGKFHRNTPVLEYLFNKVLSKRGCNTGVFLWNLQIFKNIFFYRTPPMAASSGGWVYHWKHVFREYRKRPGVWYGLIRIDTAQNMKFSIMDFFSKCDQIPSKLQNWSNLLKKSLTKNLNFCAVSIAPQINGLVSIW